MNAEFYQKLGAKIRALREAADESQQALGDALGGRTQMNISQFEQGVRKIDLETLLQLARHYKAGLEYFLGDEWRVSMASGNPMLVLDGLDLRAAFDQYLAETPVERLRNTEELRLKVLAHPAGKPRAMLAVARDARLWYAYGMTPKEWSWLASKVALRRGGYRGVEDVLTALNQLRDSGAAEG